MRRLGSGFLEEFFLEEEQSLSLIFLQKIPFLLHGLHRERIWYLDIIRINDRSSSVPKLISFNSSMVVVCSPSSNFAGADFASTFPSISMAY